jgi:hypothetical protein
MNKRRVGEYCVGLALLLSASAAPRAIAIGTAFTYQGQLQQNGSGANGQCDFEFSLWDALGAGSPPTGGNQIGGVQTVTHASVTDGVFTLQLDFGAAAFSAGSDRWLQIAVRCPAASGAYEVLAPRQPLTPAPFALFANTVADGSVSSAQLAPGAVMTSQLAPNAVTSAQIADGAVTTNDLANGAVSTTKIGDGQVTAAKLVAPLRLTSSVANTPIGVFDGTSTGVNGVGVSGTAGDGVNATGVAGFANAGTGVFGGSNSGIGVNGSTSTGIGVFGQFSGPPALTRGVLSSGTGVVGESNNGQGVRGTSHNGVGVLGEGTNDAGVNGISNEDGVVGESTGDGGVGVRGRAGSGPGAAGVRGSSTDGPGVAGESDNGTGISGTSDNGEGIFGGSGKTGGTGVHGAAMNGAQARGVFGESSDGAGVAGQSTGGYGVVGFGALGGVWGVATTTDGPGVIGVTRLTLDDDPSAIGVHGAATNGIGVVGESQSNTGVSGESNAVSTTTIAGVVGEANGSNGIGVRGVANVGNNAWAINGESTNGYAGYFSGKVNVTGALTAGVKPFKIDHPLDPANKYLMHAAVESPDMKNIYDGVVVLDAGGEAVVELPEWFEALNRDFRYQLTCIGGVAPVYIAEEVSDHRFRIAGGAPGLKVSWQVTGIRKDAFANAHPLLVEMDKSAEERGRYLYPVELGMPASLSVDHAKQAAAQTQVQ